MQQREKNSQKNAFLPPLKATNPLNKFSNNSLIEKNVAKAFFIFFIQRDLGSPLVRVVEENGQNYNYVIGIATDFIMHESGYQYVRFVRISPVKDKIEEMINKLIAESSQQCSEPSTTDLDMPNSSQFCMNLLFRPYRKFPRAAKILEIKQNQF